MILAPSADLELATRAIVFAAAGTCGQRCTTLRRLIVHNSVKAEMIGRLTTIYARLKIGDPTQDGLTVYREASALLDRVVLRQPVRLIGLSVAGLGPAGEGQLALLGPDAVRRERLARALDRLAERFGEASVRPATTLSRGEGFRRGPKPPSG